jgi:hypothetical protein
VLLPSAFILLISILFILILLFTGLQVLLVPREVGEEALTLCTSSPTRIQALVMHLVHQLILGFSHAGREHGLHVHLGLVQAGRLQDIDNFVGHKKMLGEAGDVVAIAEGSA